MKIDDLRKNMDLALQQASIAYEENEWPVGAVLVHNGVVVAKAHNQMEGLKDPTAHAEVLIIRQIIASEKQNVCEFLRHCELFVTLEPCSMCYGMLKTVQIGKIIYGVKNTEQTSYKINTIDCICEAESKILLQKFAKKLRILSEK